MKRDKIPLQICFFVNDKGIVEMDLSDELYNYDLPNQYLLRMRDLAEIFFNKLEKQKHPKP